MERIKRELNPCPGRTNTERKYITRLMHEFVDIYNYHLSKLAVLELQPAWLPEAVITPRSEADALDSRDSFENAKRDPDGYILAMHNHNQKATNRIRISSWYRNGDDDLYMVAMLAISPLPCDIWGALPLTLAQWRVIIPETILTHMQWKWVHAVRKYWSDDTYQVGGTFGWYLEPCKKLAKSESELWTGQAIYAHVGRKYSAHVQAGDTQCPQ